MQVVGVSAVDDALQAVADRTPRRAVAEWALRVLKRHVRREQSLLSRIKDASRLEKAMEADGIPDEARQRIRSAFKAKEPVLAPSSREIKAFVGRAADTMDWIESLPENDRRIRRIERMSWTDAEKLAEAWHASLAKARKASSGIMEGTRKLSDLGDGAFAAELMTKGALAAEGNAMGHCVGGYWPRVEAGETRIVSIRDESGQPHVTIELARPRRLIFEDGGEVFVDRYPGPGTQVVHEAGNGWTAVQVRGKQNAIPVPRYLGKVGQWLAESGISWVEYGAERTACGAPEVAVHTVYKRHFRSADAACAFGEPLLMKEIRKGADLRRAYAESGLASVHEKSASVDKVVSFLGFLLPAAIGEMKARMRRGENLGKALSAGALSLVWKSVDRRGGEAVRLRLFEAVREADAGAGSKDETVVAEVPGGRDLRLVVHSLPLAAMVVVARGMGEGLEDRAAEAAAPCLKAAIKRMRADPAAIHVFRAGTGGLDEQGMKSAFLFCGLAGDLAAGMEEVDMAVARLVADTRLALRRARMAAKADVETINMASNLFAEGYERRVVARAEEIVRAEFGREGLLVVSARERRPTAGLPFPLRADPPIRKYRIPEPRRI